MTISSREACCVKAKVNTNGVNVMETIQDRLREEARDYQELAAMAYMRLDRDRMRYGYRPAKTGQQHWAIHEQGHIAELYRIARSALFELIGEEPEVPSEARDIGSSQCGLE